MRIIRNASEHSRHRKLWGVTAFFNPQRYASKFHNFNIFATRIRAQGLPLCVVECAPHGHFETQGYGTELSILIHSSSVLWQKERLLNIAFEQLPPTCTMVAWLDCDVLFGSDAWIAQTEEALESANLVQPFSSATWLDHNWLDWKTMELGQETFYHQEAGCVYSQRISPEINNVQGHVGFAWAARRNCLQTCNLYDKCAVGGADTFIAAAALGVTAEPLFEAIGIPALELDLKSWSRSFDSAIQGRVNYLTGDVYHLWHGSLNDRRYLQRFEVLRKAGYDPRLDVRVDLEGCLEWTDRVPELARNVAAYFRSRREDEEPAPSSTLET